MFLQRSVCVCGRVCVHVCKISQTLSVDFDEIFCRVRGTIDYILVTILIMTQIQAFLDPDILKDSLTKKIN